MPKLLIVGAGSFFTFQWAKDVLSIPSLDEVEFSLVDVNKKRLDLSHKLVKKISEEMGKDCKIESSTSRKELMPGTDYLINTIDIGGKKSVTRDYEIPRKYGVDQCIGDTSGPGGIMKALRTIPEWIRIIKDAERLCPDALVLNYTNPLSMMVLTAKKISNLPVIGLCHSVQGTSRQLAKYANVPFKEMQWKCGGINHMNWFTKLSHKGKNLYPVLFEKLRDPKFYEQDPVRFEIMKHFGYFPSESSGHFSEYVPYFRKCPDLIDKYCRKGYLGESGFYARNWPRWKEDKDKFVKTWVEEGKIRTDVSFKLFTKKDKINLSRSNEYASYIIEAHWKGKSTTIYGNVLNHGLIKNLPKNGIVEVKTLVDETGFHPCKFGRLPEHLASLLRPHLSLYELTVKSILKSNREGIIRAMMLDPLSSAVCTPGEIKEMANELFKSEREFLPDFLAD